MLCVRRKSCPINYSKCNQTVTVYRCQNGVYTQTVHENAFLDFRKNQTINKTGSTQTNSFLLVIPGEQVSIQVGDKVLLGMGAQVTTREQWAALIPANIAGLVIVKYVDPKYWNGAQCHVEAGG